MRSKNHILYELYLGEAGESALFNTTKHYSLGHIIKFVENYEHIEGLPSTQVVSLASGEVVTSIDQMTDEHFSLYSSIMGLYEDLKAEDVTTLSVVIDRIDKYHEGRRTES